MNVDVQALAELHGKSGGSSVLWGAERQAYMNGFTAGERTAQEDVVRDEREELGAAKKDRALIHSAMLSAESAANYVRTHPAFPAEEKAAMLESEKKALLFRKDHEHSAMLAAMSAANYVRAHPNFPAQEKAAMLASEKLANQKRAEEIQAMLLAERTTDYLREHPEFQEETQAAMLQSENAANFVREHPNFEAAEKHAMLLSERAALEAQEKMEERERMEAEEHAEAEHAMLVSEKAANYAREWKLAAQKEVEAEALAKEAVAAKLQKEAAALRLQQKQIQMAARGAEQMQPMPVLAEPGSKRALELLDFCAQEFGDDQALQKFCYDKLISKPHGDSSVLNAPVNPEQLLRQRVIDAPTIQDAMLMAEKEGLDTPPQYAQLVNGELYRVVPLGDELQQHVVEKKAAAQQRLLARMTATGKPIEVDAPTLSQSVEEAHKMGFKGIPQAVVYHPAEGKEVVYTLDTPKQAQELEQVEATRVETKKPAIEVDAKTLAGSLARAHAMGLEGHPEAIVYHEADGKTELYQAHTPGNFPELSEARGTAHVARVEEAQGKTASEVRATTNGEVEVEAKTLKQSLAEAHAMGFKGSPTAIVYHPAHGKPETYLLEKPKE